MYVTLEAISIAFIIGQAVHAHPSVRIPSQKVTYNGITHGGIEHFYNIKYAHDTSGRRRFASPEPYTPNPGSVVDASSPGSACPQSKAPIPPFFSSTEDISEDCLNLRIARPPISDSERVSGPKLLPVVVWLHGGGVVKGSAYDPHFDPSNLIHLSVAEAKPIIYVSLNYRLTIFGFARLPILYKRKSLNVGMRDQWLGFHWIKDNIEAFGGDPKKITAYGLSAGGTFISLLSLAFGGTQGLPFQQVWAMSGPPGNALNITSDVSTLHTLAVSREIGCGSHIDSENQSKLLECLQRVPMEELVDTAMDYSRNNHPPAGLFTFIPSVDGDFFPDQPSALISRGEFVKNLRMIFGWTQDDGAMNVGAADTIQSEEDMVTKIKSFAPTISNDQLVKLFSLYDPIYFTEEFNYYNDQKSDQDPAVSIHYFRLSRVLRDILFTCPSIQFGHQMVQHTRATLDPDFNNVRLYDLNQSVYSPMWKSAGMPYVKVCHGSDTPYIFNNVFPEGEMTQEDQDISKKLSRSLIDFAHTGNPVSGTVGSGPHSEWPEAFIPQDDQARHMPSTFNIQVIGGPHGSGSVIVDQHDSSGSNEKRYQTNTSNFRWMGLGAAYNSIQDVLNNREMQQKDTERDRKIRQEKLYYRCSLIDSLADALGR